MNIVEELKEAVEKVYEDSDQSSKAQAYRLATLLALDAYQNSQKISCLAEARANLKNLSGCLVDAPDEVSALEELLTR